MSTSAPSRAKARATASARACEDAVLCRIPRAAFANLLRDQLGLAPYLERLGRQRALHRFLQMATFLGGGTRPADHDPAGSV